MQHIEIKIELYLKMGVTVGVANVNQNVLQASFFLHRKRASRLDCLAV